MGTGNINIIGKVRIAPLAFTLSLLVAIPACKTVVDVQITGEPAFGPLRCDPARLSLEEMGGLAPIKQNRGPWCWAASALEVMNYFGYQDLQECQLVSEVELPNGNVNLPRGCCTDLTLPLPTPALEAFNHYCEVTGWPSFIFEHFNINYDTTPPYNTLSWNNLQHQLCENGPYIFAVEWVGGGRHTGVVEGYYTINEDYYEKWVGLNDHSGRGFFLMPYNEFVQDPTSHRHYVDFFNIRDGS